MERQLLIEYYNRRAADYESIYRRSEWQSDLAELEARLIDFCRSRHVLEIGCGTGYWTRRIAPASLSVVGIDLAPEPLEVARAAWHAPGRVRFRQGDAFRLDEVVGHFTAVIATFFWSQIPRRAAASFLEGLRERFPDGVPVMLVDCRRPDGFDPSEPRTDSFGNCWYRHRLADGSEFEVLNNIPTPGELAAATREWLDGVEIRQLDCFWLLTGHLPPVPEEADESDAPRSR